MGISSTRSLEAQKNRFLSVHLFGRSLWFSDMESWLRRPHSFIRCYALVPDVACFFSCVVRHQCMVVGFRLDMWSFMPRISLRTHKQWRAKLLRYKCISQSSAETQRPPKINTKKTLSHCAKLIVTDLTPTSSIPKKRKLSGSGIGNSQSTNRVSNHQKKLRTLWFELYDSECCDEQEETAIWPGSFPKQASGSSRRNSDSNGSCASRSQSSGNSCSVILGRIGCTMRHSSETSKRHLKRQQPWNDAKSHAPSAAIVEFLTRHFTAVGSELL